MMTLNDALILSYIKRGIGYGYHILKHVRDSGSDEWVEFSRAGLYKTLDKLEAEGYVKKSLEQNGGRPPRKVYTITSKGETALDTFLKSDFSFNYVAKDPFEAFLVTAVASSPGAEFFAETVRKRREAVTQQITEFKNSWPEDTDSYLFIVYALYRRRLASLEKELEWLEWLEELFNSADGDVINMTWGDVRR